jgi:hypothetical protein
VKSPTTKLGAQDRKLLESVERGEWKSAAGGKREQARFSQYAKATFRKDRRLNASARVKEV